MGKTQATPDGDSRWIVSLDEFARLCGRHRNTVREWLKTGLITAGRTGRGGAHEIDLREALPRVMARIEARVEAELEKAAAADPDWLGAKTRKVTADARHSELDLAEREAELVRSDAVEAQWVSLVVATRERVLSLADIAHGRGACAPCAAIMRDLSDDALRDLEQQPRRAVTAADRDVIRTLARDQYAASTTTIHEMAREVARRVPAPMRDRLAEAAWPHIVDALYDIGPQRYAGDVADEAIQATVQAIVAERGEAPIAAVRASEKARVRAHFRAHGVEVGF